MFNVQMKKLPSEISSACQDSLRRCSKITWI